MRTATAALKLRTLTRPEARPAVDREPKTSWQTPSYDAKFSLLFEKYYPKIFAYVYSRVRDVDTTKDLVSEIFELAYVKGSTIRDDAAYQGWLFRVAKNVMIGDYRRKQRIHACEESIGRELRVASGPIQPEESALYSERDSHLAAMVRLLPERDQELISLRFDAEMTHVETARITGMSVVNVRVSLFRAVKRLRKLMAEYL